MAKKGISMYSCLELFYDAESDLCAVEPDIWVTVLDTGKGVETCLN